MAKTYRVHPAIGVARVGDGALEHYRVGPEVPGAVIHRDGRFRDEHSHIPRQGARFRVFEYDSEQPLAQPREVRIDTTVARIEWTVHLANAKAAAVAFDARSPSGTSSEGRLRNAEITGPDRSQRLVIDPGPRTLAGAGKVSFTRGSGGNSPEAWPGPFADGSGITSLGAMFCDPTGRMTVVGGEGRAGSISGSELCHMANNDGWFDDTADGPVNARVVFADGRVVRAAGAWVIVAPPRYAPGLRSLVTLWDVLEDGAVRHHRLRPELFDSETQTFRPDYRPSFVGEIYPVLKAATDYGWVNSSAAGRHQWDYPALAQNPFPSTCPYCWSPRQIFKRIRPPHEWNNADSTGMPFLWGDAGRDSYHTLTPLQHHLLKQWSTGQFTSDWPPYAAEMSSQITARGLDLAALQNCAGGAFHPGFEVSRIVRNPNLMSPSDPLRIRHADDREGAVPGLQPGGLTAHLAVPWQVTLFHGGNYWWPTHRPNQVRRNANGPLMEEWARGIHSREEMLDGWRGLGFVKAASTASQRLFLEDERLLPDAD